MGYLAEKEAKNWVITKTMGGYEMSQNFFSQIAETENMILTESQEEQEQYGKLRLTALREMKTAVISCAWCDTEKTRQMVRYMDMRAVDVAKYQGISPNTVRSARSKASQRLYRIFGDDVFEGIICGDEKICNRTVVLARVLTKGYDRVENFIPDTVIRHIEIKGCCSENQYEFSEIREELRFFKFCNQIVMKEWLDRLDTDKLAYIFSILKQSLISHDDVNMDKLRLLGKIIGR